MAEDNDWDVFPDELPGGDEGPEYEWERIQDEWRENHSLWLDQDTESTTEARVEETLNHLNLNWPSEEEKNIAKQRVLEFISKLEFAERQDDKGPPWIPELSDEDSFDMDELESGKVDDHLQFQAMIAQSDFVKAVAEYRSWTETQTDTKDPKSFLEAKHRKDSVEAKRTSAAKAMSAWTERLAARSRRFALNQAVAKRRADLGFNSREALAEVSGISISTIRNLETSSDPDRNWNSTTKRIVEDALEWSRGSIDAILDGGEATPLATWGNIQGSWSASQGTVVGSAEIATTKASPLFVEPLVVDMLDALALREGRNINEVIMDALAIYNKHRGPIVPKS